MSMRRAAALLIVLALAVTAGCSRTTQEPKLEPTVAPPVISKAGVLRAGVDLQYPPFAGAVDGQHVGIDVDVAAALAERLGLKLEIIDVDYPTVPAALASRRIDIALGAMQITDAALADVAFAGSYLEDGVALFSVVATDGRPPVEVDPQDLSRLKVGCQKESSAYWKVALDYGDDFPVGHDTLRGAFEALVAGQVDVVACDAIVGAYLARDFEQVGYAGQLTPAVPLGVAVPKDAPELERVVREALDALASDGVLDTIRTKWLGDLPRLTTTHSLDATTTP